MVGKEDKCYKIAPSRSEFRALLVRSPGVRSCDLKTLGRTYELDFS